MTTFSLTITLDPASAMHSGDHVQRALALTGAEIANRFDGLTLPEYLEGVIRDKNGTAVGTWSTGERTISYDQYDAVCAVIDRAKMDDRSLDTDEYGGEILAALGVKLP